MNIVKYSIGVETAVTTNDSLPELPEIGMGSAVVIEGRSPIWRYGMAFHKLHGSAASVVAVWDPRLGAVVVASHNPNFKEGDILDFQI